MTHKKPDPVDIHVGSRVRLRRTLLGISQSTLGDKLSVTFQQVQKYERGANRIGSSRLYRIAEALDVPVAFFFDDMPEEITGKAPSGPSMSNVTVKDMRLLHELSELSDIQQKAVLNVIRAIKAGSGE
ncbi:helix-turn-helix transcriptional regulator [Paremcibacter congregatus]|uniref:helix-turn-helix domain-containing protein n=1 Tax=Paremcibacter congregatus TaxID=2043170 RepID=UPI0030EC5CB7|tara:strand:+ start:779 stop:1162 length:384 start_codon:yes stop_codon:yes gene_type:complete